MACVISLPRHELLRPKQPVPAVQELRRQVLRCCAPLALLCVPFVEAALPHPLGGATGPLQRAKRSWVPLQVRSAWPALATNAASETSSDCMCNPSPP